MPLTVTLVLRAEAEEQWGLCLAHAPFAYIINGSLTVDGAAVATRMAIVNQHFDFLRAWGDARESAKLTPMWEVEFMEDGEQTNQALMHSREDAIHAAKTYCYWEGA